MEAERKKVALSSRRMGDIFSPWQYVASGKRPYARRLFHGVEMTTGVAEGFA